MKSDQSKSKAELINEILALRKSEENYRQLFSRTPLGYHSLDADGNLIAVNKMWLHLLGYEESEVIGHWFGDFLADGYVNDFQKNFSKFKTSGHISGMRFKMVTKEGGELDLECEGRIGYDNNGEFKQTHCIIENITGRRQVEEQLRENEENLRNFFNVNIDFLWILDNNGNIIAVNDTVRQRLGYKDEELVGKPVLNVHPPENRAEAEAIMTAVLKGEQDSCLVPLLTKDGVQIPVETFVTRGTWSGEPAIFGVSRDISVLKVSEQKFSKAFHRSPTIVGLSELDTGLYAEVNQTFYDLLGYKPDEIIGKKAIDLVKMDEDFREYAGNKLKEQGYLRNEETVIYAKDGTPIDVLLSADILEIDKKLYNFTTAMDITSRKEVEEQNKSILAAIPDMIFEFDKQGTFIHHHASDPNMLLMEPEHFIGRKITDLMDKDIADLSLENIHEVLADNEPRRFEYSVNINERISYFETRMVPKGKSNVLAIVRNITEQKLAQKALNESQEKLRIAIAGLNCSVFTHDRDLRFTWVYNPVSGFDDNNLLGKTDADILPPEEAAIVTGLKKKVLETGVSDHQIIRMVVDGKKSIYDVRVEQLIDDEGKITGVIGVSRDITKYIEFEEELKLAKETAESYLDIAAEIIISLDTDGNIMLLNDSGHKLLGYENGELVGKNWFDTCLSKEIVPEIKQVFRKLMAGDMGNVERYDNQVITKTGEVLIIRWHNSLLRDENNKIAGTLSSGEDITKRKQAEDELEKALKEARQANELKNLFLVNMSHEIRTPLNSVLGFTEILGESLADKISDEEQEFFQLIRGSGQRLLKTVHEILDISRIEAGVMPYDPVIIKLDGLIEQICGEFELLAHQKNLDFNCSNQIRDGVVEVDQPSVAKAITNLIDNAVKFTREGEINVNLYELDGKYVLSISDTGKGIDAEYQKNMYDTFTQESTGYTKQYQGLGLGLSIAKRCLDMNDIPIRVKSKKDFGTTFYLTFTPVGKAVPDADEKMGQNSEEQEITAEGSKPMILVVEDDIHNRRAMEIILRPKYKLLFASSVKDSKEQLLDQRIDVVLLDLSLEGEEDGLDLVSFLKNKERFKNIPVIAVTAHAFTSDRENAINAGCCDYLSKPFYASQLLEKIEKCL